jgi:hypothetical protein
VIGSVTASVRDGWLTYAWDADDGRRCCEAIRVERVDCISDVRNPITATWGVMVDVGRSTFEMEGVRAADVMELIHAGKGQIVREAGE